MDHLVIAITATKVVTENTNGEVVTFEANDPTVKDVKVGDTIVSTEGKPTKVGKASKTKGASSARGSGGKMNHLREQI